MNALHNLSVFQLVFGHSADAGGAEVVVFRLDAAKTAQLFISFLIVEYLVERKEEER